MPPPDLTAHRLLAAVDCGDRGVELRAPRSLAHLVDLVLRWRSPDAPGGERRSACGFSRDELRALRDALSRVLGDAPADGPRAAATPPSARRWPASAERGRGVPPASWRRAMETSR
jgi:hypothetical protein